MFADDLVWKHELDVFALIRADMRVRLLLDPLEDAFAAEHVGALRALQGLD